MNAMIEGGEEWQSVLAVEKRELSVIMSAMRIIRQKG
jgi:hypothetical protein